MENMHIDIRVLRLMILPLRYINSILEARSYVTKKKDQIFEYRLKRNIYIFPTIKSALPLSVCVYKMLI